MEDDLLENEILEEEIKAQEKLAQAKLRSVPQETYTGPLNQAAISGADMLGRGLDYGTGLVRTAVANSPPALALKSAFGPKDFKTNLIQAVEDWKQATQGNAPPFETHLERAGVPEGPGLSDIPGSPVTPGGAFDIKARPAAAFAMDVLTPDPLSKVKLLKTLLRPTGSVLEALGKAAYRSPLKQADFAAKTARTSVMPSDIAYSRGIKGSTQDQFFGLKDVYEKEIGPQIENLYAQHKNIPLQGSEYNDAIQKAFEMSQSSEKNRAKIGKNLFDELVAEQNKSKTLGDLRKKQKELAGGGYGKDVRGSTLEKKARAEIERDLRQKIFTLLPPGEQTKRSQLNAQYQALSEALGNKARRGPLWQQAEGTKKGITWQDVSPWVGAGVAAGAGGYGASQGSPEMAALGVLAGSALSPGGRSRLGYGMRKLGENRMGITPSDALLRSGLINFHGEQESPWTLYPEEKKSP